MSCRMTELYQGATADTGVNLRCGKQGWHVALTKAVSNRTGSNCGVSSILGQYAAALPANKKVSSTRSGLSSSCCDVVSPLQLLVRRAVRIGLMLTSAPGSLANVFSSSLTTYM